jgi:hypothetical protein
MTAGTGASRRAGVETNLPALLRRWVRSPVFYGVVAAVGAAVVGQWGGVSPPAAYGLCSACHGRDLADWLLNHVEGTRLFVTAAGTAWPILTVIGLVLGSNLAARRNGEFGSINIGGNTRQFAFGAVVMCAALFVGGCPTRIIIRSGYGDVAGLVALAGVALGIVGATLSMRWVARR